MDDCREFDSDLVDGLFGEISDEREILLNEHLAACGSCRRRERQLLALRNAVRRPDPHAPEWLRERIRAALPRDETAGRAAPSLSGRLTGLFRRPVPAYAAAIACGVIAVAARVVELDRDARVAEPLPINLSAPGAAPDFVIVESYATSLDWQAASGQAVTPVRGDEPDSL